MIILLVLLALLTYYIFNFYQKARSYPPGPFPLPLLGNVLQIGWGLYQQGSMLKVMQKWHRKYGPVITWYIGPLRSVHIGDYQLAVQTMVKEGSVYADRYKIPLMDIGGKGQGLMFANGPHWAEQKRFALKTLKNFGFGRNVMQDRIMDEFTRRANILDEQIEKEGGTLNTDPHSFIELIVGNIINRVLFSEGLSEENAQKLLSLKAAIDNVYNKPSVLDFFLVEQTMWIPPLKKRMKEYEDPIEAMLNFIGQQISDRRESIEKGVHSLQEEGYDFVDSFLIEMAKKDAGKSFNDSSLAVTIMDLWNAGLETTTTTIYWALTYLLLNPDVVKKLTQELDGVTGRERQLLLSDKPNTPYLNAVVLETLRLSTLLPINILRMTSEDTVINDYSIPKGTSVSAEMSVIMSDERIFPEYDKFLPERFLDENVDQYVIPFGLGKRACIGESLARAELYLILGNLMVFYKFELDASNPPQMRAISELGNLRKPHRFNTLISRRIK